MDDENALRQLAREALQHGKLPNRRPDRMWGGRGAGTGCSICRKPVKPEETGFELEFAPGSGETELVAYAFHIRCFAAWEFERREGAVAARSYSVQPNGHTLSAHDDDGKIIGREHENESPGERA
jgi:hypothetical protein